MQQFALCCCVKVNHVPHHDVKRRKCQRYNIFQPKLSKKRFQPKLLVWRNSLDSRYGGVTVMNCPQCLGTRYKDKLHRRTNDCADFSTQDEETNYLWAMDCAVKQECLLIGIAWRVWQMMQYAYIRKSWWRNEINHFRLLKWLQRDTSVLSFSLVKSSANYFCI